MINVRFVTGNDFISNAIRTGERDGWVTHAEAVLADGSLLGAHIDGGVQIRPAGYDKATMTRELIVRLEVAANTAPLAETLFFDFLQAQVGKPYDVTAIAGLALDRNWREDDSWFCSELMAAALETCSYLPALSATDNHISPRDLLLVLSGRIAIPNAA
jgi:hypothetical protein